MTTFEITIIMLLTAIVVLLAWHLLLTRNNYGLNQTKEWKRQQDFEELVSQLYDIKTQVGQTTARIDEFIPWAEHLRQKADNLENAWACDITLIVKRINELTDLIDKMHRNLCVEIADKMVERTFPIKKGEPLDEAFEPDYKLKKDIECKLNGFAAAVLDAECCTKEIVDFWLERICDAAHKYIKQLKIDWDKLSKEQQDEFLKRLIMPNYDSPFQSIYPPCYAPDGICTNPQRDCINCPKRGDGGTWSTNTSIKAKGEMFQEKFDSNNNKED